MKQCLILVLLFIVHKANAQSQTPLFYNEIPDSLKAKAKVIFLGKSVRYAGPRYLRSNGRSVHYFYRGFKVQKVMKGKLNIELVPKIGKKFYRRNQKYWVLLIPSLSTQKILLQKYLEDRSKIITTEEVIAIYPAKKEDE